MMAGQRCYGVSAGSEAGWSNRAKAGPEALHELLKEVQVFTRDSERGFTRESELDQTP